MRTVLERGCGLDVHKRSVTACLMQQGTRGKWETEIRTFGTSTAELKRLVDWLVAHDCRHVAMESTGVYWRPVFNVLEGAGAFEEILLVNAQHIKNVPGRKTDVKDAQWIAELLVHGLLAASFVPPAKIRELRELTRYRKKLIQQRGDQSNRIQKLLETGNIKLASVATDVLGASGWAMLQALAAGETDPVQLADLARGRLRKKIPELVEALEGAMSDTQRWLLGEQLEHIADLDQKIARLDEKIKELTVPFEEVVGQLMEIPGVSRRTAEVIIAEIGVDMKRFATSKHLASWAGMCPGHHQSAGKQRSGRTRPAGNWLKTALVEAGWAASHTKNTYLSAQYRNISRRRGKKRACVAVGHTILTIAYHLIRHPQTHYADLGPQHFAPSDRQQLAQKLIRRLNTLGFKTTVEWKAA
jgi:transposase